MATCFFSDNILCRLLLVRRGGGWAGDLRMLELFGVMNMRKGWSATTNMSLGCYGRLLQERWDNALFGLKATNTIRL